MNKLLLWSFSLACVAFLNSNLFGQGIVNKSDKFNYSKIYSFCLDANVKPVISLIDVDNTVSLSKKDLKFKTDFEKRFKYEKDKSKYLDEKKSSIDGLLKIFHKYWRASLLDRSSNYESVTITEIMSFLNQNCPPVQGQVINQENIQEFYKSYINSKGLYSTDAIGKTGRLFDLLVWETEKDTSYTISLHEEEINVKVVFMDNFITLGWEEYATLGRYYPGGWAKDNALYCVKDAYNLNSESFLISYLAHEGRHFADFKLFPQLKNKDNEYRAKLTELSLANSTLYNLIEFFIDNANYDSKNGHSVANYCVIRDLSKAIFNIDYENDIEKWRVVSIKKVNKAAYKILKTNTKDLLAQAKTVEEHIKK